MVDRQALRRASSTATATTTCPTTPRPGAWLRPASTRPRGPGGPTRSPPRTTSSAARSVADFADGELTGGVWEEISCAKAWGVVMRGVLVAVLLPSLGMERDRLRRPGLPARLHAPGPGRARALRGGGGRRRGSGPGRCGGGGCREAAAHAAQGRPRAGRQRLPLPARSPSPRDPGPRRDGLLPRRRRGRPRDRRRRSRRLDPGAAARPARLADRDRRVGPVLGSRPRLGLRRGRLPQALLDRPSRDRRRGPGRAGQEQLRPRGRRLDGPLRRLHAALPSLRLRGPDAGRRRRRLADLLPGAEAALRAGRAGAAGLRAGLALGRSAPLSLQRPSDLGGSRSRPRRRPCGRDRDADRPGRDPQRHLRQPPALHLPGLLPAGLQGQREGVARWSPTCPTRSSTASRSAPTPMSLRIETEGDRCTGVTYAHDGRGALPARRRRRGRRLLDRDPAAAAQLGQRPLSATASATTPIRSAAT